MSLEQTSSYPPIKPLGCSKHKALYLKRKTNPKPMISFAPLQFKILRYSKIRIIFDQVCIKNCFEVSGNYSGMFMVSGSRHARPHEILLDVWTSPSANRSYGYFEVSWFTPPNKHIHQTSPTWNAECSRVLAQTPRSKYDILSGVPICYIGGRMGL